ncbi:hypothetical protein VTN77DRAFT_8999 [Rasamsonia byssochlamydoides]|uniref:uncharacterized protein n=1 Tax=Rasamsonia byssochlamydoides TaxID=89139 RepID=UPI003743CBC8
MVQTILCSTGKPGEKTPITAQPTVRNHGTGGSGWAPHPVAAFGEALPLPGESDGSGFRTVLSQAFLPQDPGVGDHDARFILLDARQPLSRIAPAWA